MTDRSASSFIHRLDELDSSFVSVAGGKGSSLGELIRAGAPGFVVTAAAFQAYMKTADPQRRVDVIVRELDAGRIPVDEAAARIASQLDRSPVPEEVARAVRTAVSELGCRTAEAPLGPDSWTPTSASRRMRSSSLVNDNRPAFRSRAMQRWTQDRNIDLHSIEPGKPIHVLGLAATNS
jgi:phosphoenolpyruvate synthase/pyruvate phosphate dikinase